MAAPRDSEVLSRRRRATAEGRTVAAVLRAVVADPVARLGVAAYAAVAAFYLLGRIAPEADLTDLIFFPLLFLAARRGLGALARRQERRFFDDVTIAFFAWLAATAVTLFAPAAWAAIDVVAESLNAVYYVALVHALERRPHGRSSRLSGFERAVAWPAVAAFCGGLFVYFVLIPLAFNPPVYDASSSTLYVVLDAYVSVRFLLFVRAARDAAWRALYALMALASASFLFNSLVNSLHFFSSVARPWGLPSALVWNATFLCFILACRARLASGPLADLAVSTQGRVAARAREKTLIFALSFPALHFAGYASGLLDAPSRPAREAAMALWLLLIGSIALFQRRLLVESHLLLDRAAAAMSEELEGRRRLEEERERFIRTLEAKNAEVRSSNAEMERFSYAISHDLRNPLITIMTFSGLLEANARKDARVDAAAIDRIEAASEKLAQLLEDLLDLSRAGRRLEASEEVPLGEVAGEAASLMAERIAERSAEVAISPDLPVVRGDRHRLLELMRNLLDNAVKFAVEGRPPRVEIGPASDGVVYVRDNGSGIDARYHEKIFGVFDQLDPRSEGAGLGLALARRIVEVHGGRIWVESAGDGTGSTFFFTLPRARPRQPGKGTAAR